MRQKTLGKDVFAESLFVECASSGVFEALPSVLDTLAKLPIPVVNVLQQHFLCVGSPVPWMLIGSCSSMSFSLVGLKAKQP